MRRTASVRPMPLWPTLAHAIDGRPTSPADHEAEAWGRGRGHLDGPASASGQLLERNHLRLDPRRLGRADPTGTSRLAHSLAFSKSHSHLLQKT